MICGSSTAYFVSLNGDLRFDHSHRTSKSRISEDFYIERCEVVLVDEILLFSLL
jgi:hypothetical protein